MSKRRELMEQQRAKERKQTVVILAVIAVLAIVLIGGAIVLSQRDSQPHTLVIVNEPAPPNAEKNGRAWGPVDAPIKVLEFTDMQCPGCGDYVARLEPGVVAAFASAGKVRYESRSLTFIGQESVDAAKAALCAMDQDKFWQMHATIFANQSHGENAGNFTKDNLKAMAMQLGLDSSVFNKCLDSTKYDDQLSQDRDEGSRLSVNQTPSFIVNGKLYSGAQSPDDMRRIFSSLAPDVKLQ